MVERPILFSGPMVRALLAGTKTQTRRAMKHQPDDEATVTVELFNQTVIDRHGDEQPGPEVFGAWWADGECGARCPYGAPGDQLWVRESFWGCDLPGYGDTPCVVYDDEWRGKEYHPTQERPWARKFGRIPSIHMPRDCSRIQLEVTGVRVERLQSISEADALAEGIIAHRKGGFHVEQPPQGIEGSNHFGFKTARDAYRVLWEEISGPGSVEANPWVWAVSFKRIE